MPTHNRVHGLYSYLKTSSAIADRERGSQSLVLGRILLAKVISGVSAFEYGIYGLHAKPLASISEYLTKKQTTALFQRVNDVRHRPQVDDKLAFHRRCRAVGIPTADVLAVLNANGVGDGDELVLGDFPALLEQGVAGPEADLILKPRRDSLGTGVRFVALRNGNVFDLEGSPLDVERFGRELALDMQRDDYLVQPFVRAHADLATLGAGRALGTLRILTFVDGGVVHVLYVLMRIPAEGNVHDNFGSGANGNLIAKVDARTGQLSAAWGREKNSASRLLQKFDRNPSTHARIEGVSIPLWKEVEDLVARAALQFSELPCLAWDIAVTPQGPLVIEANANADIIGAQVCCGVGARRLLQAVIDRYGF